LLVEITPLVKPTESKGGVVHEHFTSYQAAPHEARIIEKNEKQTQQRELKQKQRGVENLCLYVGAEAMHRKKFE
jgi:hypothetical protein